MSTARRGAAALLAAAMLGLAVTDGAPAWAADEPGPRDLAAIKAAGELRVAADPSAGAPYFAVAPSGHVGFEAELGQALAAELGLKAVFVPTAWRELRQALADGRADVALNALEIRDDAAVRFSAPYYVASQAIAVRAGEVRIYDVGDLAGRKVATTRGSVAAAILARLKPPATAVMADDTETPFQALAKQDADAVLLESAMVRAWIKKAPGKYRLAGRPLLPRPYGVAVRRANTKLLAAVDAALAGLRKRGQHGKILRAYGLWDSLQDGKPVATMAMPGAAPATPKPLAASAAGSGARPAMVPTLGPTPAPSTTPRRRRWKRVRRHRVHP